MGLELSELGSAPGAAEVARAVGAGRRLGLVVGDGPGVTVRTTADGVVVDAGVDDAGLVVAIAGYLTSRGVPSAPAPEPGLTVNPNPLTETWRNINFARANRTVFLSILGISGNSDMGGRTFDCARRSSAT